jgi:hypothetical protein
MAKRKAGLHKKVSSIFDGAPLPAQEKTEQTTAPPQAPVSPSPPPPAPRTEPPKPPAPRPAPVVKKKSRPEIETKPFWKRERKRFGREPDVDKSKQKKMGVLLLVLTIVFVVVLFQQFYSSRQPKKVEGTSGLQSQSVGLHDSAHSKVTIDDSLINWKIPEPYPTDLRDPMHVPTEVVAPTSQPIEAEPGSGVVRVAIIKDSIVVKSILYSEESSSAVVGDEIVREGQIVLGAKVIRINPYSVEFEVNGERFLKSLQD